MNETDTNIIPLIKLRHDIHRLKCALEAAHSSSIDIKNSQDFYTLAFKELYKFNEVDAIIYYERAKYELTSEINGSKLNIHGFWIPSQRTISFLFKYYGIYSIIYGLLSAILFAVFIYNYGNIKIQNLPLWSAFYAGLGSSVLILCGASKELRRNGYITTYKRGWYIPLPAISLIFGLVVYILFNIGLIEKGADSVERVSLTILICFLTGFVVSWLIDRSQFG